MSKRLRLETRSFGAETGVPEVAELSAWIAGHRGKPLDLTRFRILQSLAPQLEHAIDIPCAGGKYLRDRIITSLTGITGGKATGDIFADTGLLAEDASAVAGERRGTWCALPAPHLLLLSDHYYHDADEWASALAVTYRAILRAMRDAGVTGHVLICDRAEDRELAALAGPKVFFFLPAADREDLSSLMEYQRNIAIGNRKLDLVFDLADEYTLRKLFIIDPDPAAIELSLSRLDPDRVNAAGYCTVDCGNYWKGLAASAEYERSSK